MIDRIRAMPPESKPLPQAIVAWEVEINYASCIVFAATKAKAKWAAVKAYWDAYGRPATFTPMPKRTKEEIAAEVAALKALKPFGLFARKTAAAIQVQIEAVEEGIDDTADEFNDLTDEQQDAARECENWRNGDTDEKPSESWGGLVK